MRIKQLARFGNKTINEQQIMIYKLKGAVVTRASNCFENCDWVLQVSLKFFACRKNMIHFTAAQCLNYLYFVRFSLCEPDYSHHLKW